MGRIGLSMVCVDTKPHVFSPTKSDLSWSSPEVGGVLNESMRLPSPFVLPTLT